MSKRDPSKPKRTDSYEPEMRKRVRSLAPDLRRAIEVESVRVLAARMRVWCEYRIQEFRGQHSTTKLDAVLLATVTVVLRDASRTVDEFARETVRERTVRIDKARYDRKKRAFAEATAARTGADIRDTSG